MTGRLPAGEQRVRWRLTTDATELSRGVVVDGVGASARDRTLLDAEADLSALIADGWLRHA